MHNGPVRMRYPAGDANILNFGTPTDADPGLTVDVEPTIFNSASETSAVYLVVESPDLSDHVTMWCGLISGGETLVVDGSTSLDPGLDGSFTMPSHPVELQFTAGGFNTDDGTDCTTANFPGKGTTTDTGTFTIEPIVSVSPSDFSIVGCTLPDTVRIGDTNRFIDVAVRSSASVDADVTIEVREASSGTVLDTSTGTVAAGRDDTITAQVDYTDVEQWAGGDVTVEAVVTSVQSI